MNFAWKDGRLKAVLKPLGLLLVVGSILAGCAKLPDDGKSAKDMRFDKLRDMRYCEVFLIGGDAVTHDLKAAFYNTTDLNNTQDPRDTCPAAVWDKVDAESLKKQYDVLGVFKNGPRHWAMDWIQLPVGAERKFDGLSARWMGEVQLPKDIDLKKKGSSAYKPTTVARKSEMGFMKGPARLHSGRPRRNALGHAGLLQHRRPGPELRRSPDARQQAQAAAWVEVSGEGFGSGSYDPSCQRPCANRSGRP